jgi:pimeloyl-ACP methyl ester carboxylesterase
VGGARDRPLLCATGVVLALVLFDRRRTGLSDPVHSAPTFEQQMDDLNAVLEAVGSDRTAIFGASDLGLSALFAATYPDRVSALVLSGVAADGRRMITPDKRQLFLDAIERERGEGTLTALFAPSQADNRAFAQWWTHGFLATFDGPARAMRCAAAIVDSVGALGLPVRAGVHTGECELVGDDVAGIAVRIGARVMERADPGEVLASSTVRDLVIGSGLQFADRGRHALRGMPAEWHLYAVDL